jgi:uncharacterized protein YbjT (DUF2867 family)
MELVAADDVAATVTDVATAAPVGDRIELGGLEALGIDAWARRLFAATGDGRTVVSDPHGRYFATELTGDELTACCSGSSTLRRAAPEPWASVAFGAPRIRRP